MPVNTGLITQEYRVGGVYVEKGEREIGRGFKLRRFQEKVLKHLTDRLGDEKFNGVLFLSAPTGSGKTLTLLLPWEAYREHGFSRGFGVVGFYPSNELLLDQFASIKNLLGKIYGLHPAGNIGLPRNISLLVNDEGMKVVVTLISGRILKELEPHYPGRNHLEILEELASTVSRLGPDYKIVLSTPDLHYYLELGLYTNPQQAVEWLNSVLRGEEPRVTGLKDRLSMIGRVLLRLGYGPVVFYDEYHSWSLLDYLTSLALISIMSSEKIVVLSSATPLDRVKKHLEDQGVEVFGEVNAEPSSSGDLVKSPTRLVVYGYDKRDAGGGLINIYNAQKMIPMHLENNHSLLSEHAEANDGQVLVILDRIAYAVEAYNVLVSRNISSSLVTGFRKIGDPVSSLFIVGNKAIELGIDNPRATTGVVTGKSYSSIIQRIGRIGRRKPPGTGESLIHLVISRGKLEELTGVIGSGENISYTVLSMGLSRVLPSELRLQWLYETVVGREYVDLLKKLYGEKLRIIYSGGTPPVVKAPRIEAHRYKRLAGIMKCFTGVEHELLELRTSGVEARYKFAETGEEGVYDLLTILRNYPLISVDYRSNEPVITISDKPNPEPNPITGWIGRGIITRSLRRKRVVSGKLRGFWENRRESSRLKLLYNARSIDELFRAMRKPGEIRNMLESLMEDKPATLYATNDRGIIKIMEYLTYTSYAIPVEARDISGREVYLLIGKLAILPYMLDKELKEPICV